MKSGKSALPSTISAALTRLEGFLLMAGKFKGKEAVGVGYLKEITEGYYIWKAQVSTIEVEIALRDSDIPLEELKEKAPIENGFYLKIEDVTTID